MDEGEDLVWLVFGAFAVLVLAQASDPGSLGDLLLVAPAVVAFVLRGLVPRLPAEVFAALVIIPVAVVVAERRVLEGTLFLIVNMVLAVSWRLASTRRAALIAVVAAVTPLLVSVRMEHRDIGWEAWLVASIFTFVVGRLLRRQQVLIDQLNEARDALAARAVAEERRHIARELHDLAGHTLAAVLLHVTGARHVLRRDVDDAERALLDAETVGRASLDQIRAAVATLRTDERGTDPALAGPGDLAALVDEYRRAGLVVAATIVPSAVQLDGPVGTALHRIAREALANVVRHAPANQTELVLNGSAHEVRLVVADHGRPAERPDPLAGHFGIIGMRERAQALGGRLDAGPTADGWRVEARLPIAAGG